MDLEPRQLTALTQSIAEDPDERGIQPCLLSEKQPSSWVMAIPAVGNWNTSFRTARTDDDIPNQM
jgi:hypothetical protein